MFFFSFSFSFKKNGFLRSYKLTHNFHDPSRWYVLSLKTLVKGWYILRLSCILVSIECSTELGRKIDPCLLNVRQFSEWMIRVLMLGFVSNSWLEFYGHGLDSRVIINNIRLCFTVAEIRDVQDYGLADEVSKCLRNRYYLHMQYVSRLGMFYFQGLCHEPTNFYNYFEMNIYLFHNDNKWTIFVLYDMVH
jgi:hypothetical protein